ncbi:MAG: hypothetical protein NDJ75_09325 [Thermoanaerobaculia bacterium]|nr:hypothetical protein [Thermoanaerobaculia bacterium]
MTAGAATAAATAAPATLQLELAGARVVVTTPAAADLEWLAEFLSPPFDARAGAGDGGAGARVDCAFDPSRHAALTALDWTAAQSVATFALDAGAVELPLREEAAGWRVVRDEPFAAFHRVAADLRRVETVAARSEARLRTPLLRLVRELVMGELFARGWPMLHASAVARDGVALAFLGATGAGKTSLLLHALRLGGARLLANDRAVVRDDGRSPAIFAVPTIFTLRESALAFFPAVAAALAASRFSHRLTLAEAAHDDAAAPRPWRNGKYGLTPAQLARLLGVERQGEARLAGVVLPRHTGQSGGLTLRRLDREAARRELHDAQFGHGAWMRPSALFRPAGVDDETVATRRAGILDRLAGDLPVHVAELGLDAYADGDGLARLGALLEARP